MIKNLIALPYEVARRPLDVVGKLAERLPDNSYARLSVDRTLGTADRLAGTVLRNDDISQRGSERLERSSRLAAAADLEQHAASKRKYADKTVTTARKEAAAKREEAQDRVTTGLEEADEVELREKQQAEARARKTAAEKKAEAERLAAAREEQVGHDEQRVKTAAAAKRQAAQRRTKKELDEARETEQEASEKRADAERLEELTEAKKAARKAD
ncbi:hypothetical protein [Nocardioides panacisoli]|uniref:IF2 family translation initiation factor n=1 Tax=Nocardioides panacisoli TaxID=627624 RepID=A0ABP7HRJ5_9ACTN